MDSRADQLPAIADIAARTLREIGAERIVAPYQLSRAAQGQTGPIITWLPEHDPGPDADPFAVFDHIEPITEAVSELIGDVPITLEVTAARDRVHIDWFEYAEQSLGDIVTLKLGRKRRKGTPPEAVPLTDRVADNDDEEIRRLLASRGLTKGFTEAKIARAEAKRKIAFPPELRTFFSLVDQEAELVGPPGSAEDPDATYARSLGSLMSGAEAIGNVVDARKRIGTNDPIPTMRAATPDDVVQPVFASKGWIVFADDWGGNQYAVDLVPGPKGRIGQIVQFDHERDEPPQLVAWSLTDFLAGRVVEPPAPTPLQIAASQQAGDTEVMLSTHLDRTAIWDDEIIVAEKLFIGPLPEAFDFNRLRGASQLIELRLSEDQEGRDLSALRTLTALEHLEAPISVWRAIAEQDAWPPGLVSGTFRGQDDASLIESVTATNQALEHYGRPPFDIHTWTG